MGRHSAEPRRSPQTLWVGIALVVVVSLIAAGIYWFTQRGDDASSASPNQNQQQDCTEVTVASTDSKVAERLVNASGNKEGVCAKVADSTEEASVFIAPQSPITAESLKEAGIDDVEGWKPVASVAVGLAGKTSVDAPTVALKNVNFSDASQPEANALVAETLGATGNANLPVDGQWRPTVETQVHSDEVFSPLPDVELVYYAAQIGNQGSSSQQRAQVDEFIAEAAQNYTGPKQSPEVSQAIWNVILESQNQPATKQHSDAELADTLFLLDTSEKNDDLLPDCSAGHWNYRGSYHQG